MKDELKSLPVSILLIIAGAELINFFNFPDEAKKTMGWICLITGTAVLAITIVKAIRKKTN
jgi:hypothetical protein